MKREIKKHLFDIKISIESIDEYKCSILQLNKQRYMLNVHMINYLKSSIDVLVKSRHSGEDRSPDALETNDITGFRPSLE